MQVAALRRRRWPAAILPALTPAINAMRTANGLSAYTGRWAQPIDLLQYERRVALLFMGRPLNDMYRFGVVDPTWNVNSTGGEAARLPLPDRLLRTRVQPAARWWQVFTNLPLGTRGCSVGRVIVPRNTCP
jgi:hypothetical protein